MNANEVSPRAGARLRRIKMISRTIKALFLLYFIFLILFFVVFARNTVGTSFAFGSQAYASFSSIPFMIKLVGGLCYGLFLVAIVTGYQLLNLYEKGIFFSAKNVRLFGRIGYLASSYGLICICAPILVSARLGIFPFLISLASSPWIIGGLFIVVISLIMDEGRKIQEEQELTV
jgi:uncharacterized integral membrane protein